MSTEARRALAALLLDGGAPDLLDEDGRPVGEVGSSLYRSVTTDLVVCPYADARRGGAMNRSALRQMGSCWPELLATFRALAGPEPTVHAGFRAAVVGITAPAAHAVFHPGAPIPRPLSALYKTSLGLSQVLSALLLADDGVADAPLVDLGDGPAFFRFLDDGRWLVGDEQVCAGTEGMIGEAWSALCGSGDGRLAPPLAALDPPAWTDMALVVIGAIAVAGLAVGGDPAGLERWIGTSGPAWTRSLFAVPGRTPAHAARLFPSRSVPRWVEAMIELPSASGEEWADRVREAVRRSC